MMIFAHSCRKVRRTAVATAAAVACFGVAVSAERASAAPDVGMPEEAAGAVYTGWASDVEATCLFSREFAVTTGEQIDVYLPDELKAQSFSARWWMKIANASGSHWVSTGWQAMTPSTDNGYPIHFAWSVSGRQTAFYPAVELSFANGQVHTFSLAVTKTAGSLSGGGAQPCQLGG